MMLNRRYSRSIKSYLSFYISASVLTMVSLLIFFLFYSSATGLESYADDFAKSNAREDAQFETLEEISDENISSLSQEYNVVIEREKYINIAESSGCRSRIFKESKSIDLIKVTDGVRPANENEVMISLGYAEEHNISVGDKITVGRKERKITGFFLRPDYLFMVENDTDAYKNVNDFFLAILDDKTFDSEFEEPSVLYKVRYNDKSKETDFRKRINKDFFALSYLSADVNGRINYIYQEADTYFLMSWILLLVLPLTAVVLVCLIISRKITKEQKIIGTLSALGRKPGTIMLHYGIMALIPGIIGGVLVSIVTVLIADNFGAFATASFEPIKPDFGVPVYILILGAVIPTLLYFIAALLVTRKTLKNNIVTLLSGAAGAKSKSKKIFTESKMKVRTRFALRSVIGSFGRSFVIFLGIFLGGAIMCFANVYSDSMIKLADDPMSQIGSYKYRYYLIDYKEGTYSDNTDVLVNASFESESGSIVNVIGADSGCKRLNIKDSDTGNDADLESGWYISSLASKMFGAEKGDDLKLKNNATLEEKIINVKGIIDNSYEIFAISTRENASKLTGLDAKYYDCILSDEKIDFEKDDVALIASDNTVKDQMNMLVDESKANRIVIMLLGAVICISAIYVALNMMINEQSANISMLKVLGYKRSYIDTMILRGNHILLIPGIVFGVLAGMGIMTIFSESLVEITEMILPVEITALTVVITCAAVLVCYFGSLFVLRRRVDDIDMIESLKDNRD